MLHVFSLGPIRLEDRTTSFAVVAHDLESDEIASMHVGRARAEGLALVAGECRGEKIVVEPALAKEGKKLGFPAMPLELPTLELRAAVAMMLYAGFNGEHFDALAPLVDACASLAGSLLDDDLPLDVPLRVRIVGGIDRTYEAVAISDPDAGLLLLFTEAPGSLARLLASQNRGGRDASFFALTVALEPEVISTAVADAFGTPAFPFIKKVVRGAPADPSLNDMLVLAAAAEAIASLDSNNVRAEHTIDGADEAPLTAIAEVLHAPVATPVKVGRNDPCPCGSKKKYKKCCMSSHARAERKAQDAKQYFHELDERVLRDLEKFVTRKYPGVLQSTVARLLKGGETLESDRHFATALALYSLTGSVERYLEEPSLDKEACDWLEIQKKTRLSIWEVVAFDRGQSLTLKDVLTGEEREVQDVGASQTVRKWSLLLGRVVDCGELSILCGTNPRSLPPEEGDAVSVALRKVIGGRGRKVDPARLLDPKIIETLCELWRTAWLEIERRPRPEVLTTDGDPVVICADRLRVNAGAFARVKEKLVALEEVRIDREDDRGAALCFVRKGNAVHKTWDETTIGGVDLRERELKCSTMSARRADDLRARIEAAAGDDVVFIKRDITPFDRPKSGSKGPIYFDSQRVRTSEQDAHLLMRDARRSWLTEPLVALDGITPRDAMNKLATRRKLDLLLKTMENAGGEDAEEDIAWLRDQLGLAVGGRKGPRVDAQMSDTIVEFVRPILVEVEDGDVDEFQEMFDVATGAWNGAIINEQVPHVREIVLGGHDWSDPERAGSWFDILFARKRELFAEDQRIVGAVELDVRDGILGVRTSFAR